jgi:hypothetical protein
VAWLAYLWLAPSGLWLDEAVSARIAALPPATFVRFVTQAEPNMALFHLLLAPVAHQHPSDVVLRALPALFGALAVGTTYLFGARLFGRSTALLAAAILGVSGVTTAYANQVRGYSLLMLLTVLSSVLLVRAVRADRAGPWVAFTVVAVLGLGAQQVAAFTIVAQFASLAALGRDLPWRRVVGSAVATAGAFVLWRAVTFRAPQSAGISWIPDLSLTQVGDTLRTLSGGTTATVLVVGTLFGAGVVLSVLHARRSGLGVEAFPDVLLVSTAVVPVAIGLVFSLVQPLFLSRYYVAVLPPAALLVARAVTALPRRPTLPALAGAVVVAAVLVANPTIDLRVRDGSPAAVDHLLASARPGDAVLLPYNEQLPMLQWYGDGRLGPATLDPHPGVPADALATDWWWEDPGRDVLRAGQIDPDRRGAEAWRASLADLDRVWVLEGFLATDPEFHDDARDVVTEGREVCEQRDFAGVGLVLYARRCD